MELKQVRTWLQGAAKNRKAVQLAFILGMLGILLIWISGWTGQGKSDEVLPDSAPSAGTYQRELEESLGRIIRAMTGEASPEVMVTLENAGSSVYAADRKEGDNQRESAHVILEDSAGAEHGLTVEERQPEVKGVVIVSRAAGDPAVREQLVNAARTALGVPANRVCVVSGR